MNSLKHRLITLSIATAAALTIQAKDMNPFFDSARGIHGTFLFDNLKVEHYMPAFEAAMKSHSQEIDAIVNNPDAPSFANTIEALEASGNAMSEVAGVFFNLEYTEGTKEMMAISQEISPLLSKHQNDITLNEALFARIKAVYDQRESLDLNGEQLRLLRNTYRAFAKNGANLTSEGKAKYRQLSEALSQKTLTFGQNVLMDTNNYDMVLTDPAQLIGLPADYVEQCAERAKERGQEGHWLVNLQAPSYIPFMKYSEDRSLRERLYRSYSSRSFNDSEYSNASLVTEIANLRLEIANLLGYPDYASYLLEEKMAKTPQGVMSLLDQLLEAFKATALDEVVEIEAIAQVSEGVDFILMPWDWSYYAEQLKSARFSINDNVLKPYFALDNVKQGVFDLATTLYGITFTRNTAIQPYSKGVEAYEVHDKDGSLLAVFYVDFFPRDTKRPGAWMTEFRAQRKEAGERVIPFVSIVMNFTPATATTPSLLTYDEVETLLHEFGHALHGMLSDVTYESLAGTSVYQDFVELPSQIMENFLAQQEYLDSFALHYKTGEKIPAEVLDKIKDAARFNAGYSCLRQLSFGYLDMAWHTARTPITTPVDQFERNAFSSTQLLPMVDGACMSTAFTHLFSGGYAAGYYGYKWAEVLDADAFSLFLERGIFDSATATSFRENILSKGGSEDPSILYERFRGRKPSVDALLKRELGK